MNGAVRMSKQYENQTILWFDLSCRISGMEAKCFVGYIVCDMFLWISDGNLSIIHFVSNVTRISIFCRYVALLKNVWAFKMQHTILYPSNWCDVTDKASAWSQDVSALCNIIGFISRTNIQVINSLQKLQKYYFCHV